MGIVSLWDVIGLGVFVAAEVGVGCCALHPSCAPAPCLSIQHASLLIPTTPRTGYTMSHDAGVVGPVDLSRRVSMWLFFLLAQGVCRIARMGVAWVLLVVACDAVCSHPRASFLPWGFVRSTKQT